MPDNKWTFEVLRIGTTGRWIYDRLLMSVYFIPAGKQYGRTAQLESDRMGWTIGLRRNEDSVRGATLKALRRSIELVKKGPND